MSSKKNHQFLEYYQRELTYLRNAGAHFARRYPKIARRLELGPTEAGDPHVERLIESFAYLTAKLQKEIDDDFSRIPAALLGVLYPQLTTPFPAATIVCFEVSAGTGNLTSGVRVPRGLPLFTESLDHEICRFQTCYDVDLWPLKITQAEVVRTEVSPLATYPLKALRLLRLRLETLTADIRDLDLSTLRIYLHGESHLQYTLYQALFAQDAEVMVVAQNAPGVPEGVPTLLPPKSLQEVGFGEGESLFPYPAQGHPAYGFLSEYFRFPHKFLFCDIKNLTSALSNAQGYVDFYIALPNYLSLDSKDVGPQNFLLGCAPAINLFEKISEPFLMDHKTLEHRMVADIRRERFTEIHSVKTVWGIEDHLSHPKAYHPYFSFDHSLMQQDAQTFWYARRVPSQKPQLPGTDMNLVFVDFSFTPHEPSAETIYADLLCTNRDLSVHIPPGALFQSEDSVPAARIVCLDKPTVPTPAPTQGESQWRLISHLSLNHLSLSSDTQGLTALKEILRVYSGIEHEGPVPETESIHGLEIHPIVRRMGREAWRGFLQGTKITLTLDESLVPNGSTFLFATILNHFFGLYTALNSFTQLEIHSTQREGIWKQWPPVNGAHPLL